MLTQERMRELLADYDDVDGCYGVMYYKNDVLDAMTRAVQEAVEEAAKVADAQTYDAPRGPDEAILSEGAAQIATAIRSLAPRDRPRRPGS